MRKVTLEEARTLALHSQYLLNEPPLEGKSGVLRAIEQIGYVQIDTISVIKRAHHHVLWNRVPGYEKAHLKTLEEKDRAIFEYWAHAASYLPMRDYRFSLVRKAEIAEGEGHWYEKDPKATRYVLDRIREEGPLMSKDFKNPDPKKEKNSGMDWSRNPLNVALRHLFMEGEIMVIGRRGFQKVYDLPERVLPPGVDTRRPSRREYFEYIVERDVRAHGLIRDREIGYLLKGTQESIDRTLKKMVKSGELVQIQVDAIPDAVYYALPESLSGLTVREEKEPLQILSPFDNLVIQRQRLEELFGFKYVLECYVPKAKRQFGYFCLPLLSGTEFVGQIDLKAHRRTEVLEIRNLTWEGSVTEPDRYWEDLAASLRSFMAFNECKRIEPGKEFIRK